MKIGIQQNRVHASCLDSGVRRNDENSNLLSDCTVLPRVPACEPRQTFFGIMCRVVCQSHCHARQNTSVAQTEANRTCFFAYFAVNLIFNNKTTSVASVSL